MTRTMLGDEIASHAERLVPGSVARAEAGACFLRLETLRETMEALRTDPATDLLHLTNLCGVDYWDHFEVVYHAQSFDKNQLACIKAETYDHDAPVVPSVTPVWFGAWMQECEAYDLLGITFEGHPRLYRIFLWDGYPGFPLRKDFLSMPGGLQPGLSEFAGVAPRQEPPRRAVQ